jgi:hypothetical protein
MKSQIPPITRTLKCGRRDCPYRRLDEAGRIIVSRKIALEERIVETGSISGFFLAMISPGKSLDGHSHLWGGRKISRA